MVLLSRIEIGWFRVFTNERKFSFLLLYLKIAINVNEKTSPNGQIDIVCLLSWEFQTIRWNNYYIPFVQFCIFEVLWHTQAILKALVIFDVSAISIITYNIFLRSKWGCSYNNSKWQARHRSFQITVILLTAWSTFSKHCYRGKNWPQLCSPCLS